MDHFLNPRHRAPVVPVAPHRLGPSVGAQVQDLIAAVFAYRPTPLVALPTLAAQWGIRSVHIKDEGTRLGLRSFKALGGAYALLRLVAEAAGHAIGRPLVAADLPRALSGSLDSSATAPVPACSGGHPAFGEAAARMTFACATDGNHGQSVAAGARLVGARAIIYVHHGVTRQRREAIARFGAEVREVRGSYDDAVATATRDAALQGWTLLSDTSWPGYEDVPQWVMQGYTLITRELATQVPEPPTHVFLQAGVGGFAAALAVSMAQQWQAAPPRFVVVEPLRAACLLASARAGRAVRVPDAEPTLMSMLECYEPSLVAWQLLAPLASAFLAINEQDAVAAMRLLAHREPTETMVAGESGAAGLAGCMAAMADPTLRSALALDAASRVLLVNTEGATDPDRYRSLVGVLPAAVDARAFPA